MRSACKSALSAIPRIVDAVFGYEGADARIRSMRVARQVEP